MRHSASLVLSMLLCGPALASALPAHTGLTFRYLMDEKSGTTLNDSSGHGNNVAFANGPSGSWGAGGLPAWSADGGLTFANGDKYLIVPAAANNIRTVQVVFAGGVQTGLATSGVRAGYTMPQTNTPIGSNSVYLQFSPNYDGTVEPYGGWGTQFVSYYVNGQPTSTGEGCAIDNGLHVLGAVIEGDSGQITTYLDGRRCGDVTAAHYSAAALTGHWTIGGAGGANGRSEINNGFIGTIYEAEGSTSASSARQMAVSAAALRAYALSKGARSSIAEGPSPSGPVIYSLGESVDRGNGLRSPAATNFTVDAASELSALTRQPWTGIADGSDSASTYTMTTVCATKFLAMAHNALAPRIAVLHDHGNGDAPGGGYNPWPNVPDDDGTTSIRRQAMQDVISMAACARKLKTAGYTVFYTTRISSGSGVDTVKDIHNPLLRKYAGLFDGVIDLATDPRLGADNAGGDSARGGPNSTTCRGGSPYQSDETHPTACGQSILGHEVVAAIEDSFGRRSQVVKSVASATYDMAPSDLEATIMLSAPAASFTLTQAGGLLQGARIVTLVNRGRSAVTVDTGSESDGGPQDKFVNGTTSTSYLLPGGQARSFLISFSGDAAGSNSILVQAPKP